MHKRSMRSEQPHRFGSSVDNSGTGLSNKTFRPPCPQDATWAQRRHECGNPTSDPRESHAGNHVMSLDVSLSTDATPRPLHLGLLCILASGAQSLP